MDSRSWITEEPSSISLSTVASEEDDSLRDEFNQLNFSIDGHHHMADNENALEQMSNHIKRLEKRMRYLERKYVECKKENKILKSQVKKYQTGNFYSDIQRTNEQEQSTAFIGSQAASLRVIHDIMNMINIPKENENNPSESCLMDLVRSLHYLSLELVPNRAEDGTPHRS